MAIPIIASDVLALNSTLGPGLILASASPRRQSILRALGVAFELRPAAIDEARHPGEAPGDMVLRLACAKAQAVAERAGTPILAADTAVVVDDEVFGKPRGEEHALEMLARLSGRTHQVYSGVALHVRNGMSRALSCTEVRFRDIDPGEARRYWQTGEPAGKAGAYAIQGFGGLFVASIMGSYSGVVGLPVFETAGLLRAAGIEVLPGAKSSP